MAEARSGIAAPAGPPAMTLQLAVEDLDTTEAFYAGILGMPVERALTWVGAPEHLVMNLDGFRVIFVDESELVDAHPFFLERLESFPKGIGMTLHLEVSGIGEIYQAILEEDLEVLYPLERKPYGTLELWCFDPDGYLVVMEERIKAGER